jgi:hypothetical protein
MKVSSLKAVIGAVGLAAAAAVSVAAAPAPQVSITVKDLTPKFLTFYRTASATHPGPDARFELWKRDYGFAAVPPTPDGDAIARRLLDKAWPDYPPLIGRIEKGAAGIEPSPETSLRRVAALLRPETPVHITLLAYVGAMEGNAFTMGQDGKATVAVPVEQSPRERGPIMAHEFTHAVQIVMGTNSGGWVRSVGETALAEGLAMRVAQRLYPDRPAASFVEMPDEPGWLNRANGRRRQILMDIRAAAASSSSDDVMRFTMGTGPAGFHREAYYVGWLVTGYWLSHGRSLADIARIPESRAPAEVTAAVEALLAQPHPAS